MQRLTLAPLIFTHTKIGRHETKLTIDAFPHLRRPDPGRLIPSLPRFLQCGKGDSAAEPLTTQGGRRRNIVDTGNAAGRQKSGGCYRLVIQITDVVQRAGIRFKSVAGIGIVVDLSITPKTFPVDLIGVLAELGYDFIDTAID